MTLSSSSPVDDSNSAAALTGAGLPGWEQLARTAPAWEPFDDPLLVVVPHPDDETLSAGALIARQARAGRPVTILAVTDGDAAYGDADAALAALRRREQDAAVETLGVSSRHIERLGVPDGRVTEHEERVTTAIVDLLRPDTVVVAPWRRDVHPDHESCGRAAAAAIDRFSAARPATAQPVPVTLVYGVFWACHHRDPASIPDRYEPLAIDLDDDLDRRRAAALACHRSQFEHDGDAPILDHSLVAPATWHRQLFLRPR